MGNITLEKFTGNTADLQRSLRKKTSLKRNLYEDAIHITNVADTEIARATGRIQGSEETEGYYKLTVERKELCETFWRELCQALDGGILVTFWPSILACRRKCPEHWRDQR